MKTNKEKWIFTAILAVIEIFLTAAELGFFTIGKIAFTILHIPVFIAVIEIGLLQGFILAAIFGFSSLVSAYLHANGLLDYLFQDPRISVLPRLLIPFAVWLIYRAVRNIADDNTFSADLICSGFAAMSGVAANAFFVITAIAALSPEALGITEDLSASTVIVSNLVAANIAYEIVIAVAVTCLTVLVLRKRPYRAEDQSSQPIRKTFRKWLFLFMVLTFFLMLVFLYSLFSKQDRSRAEVFVEGEAEIITSEIEDYGIGFSKEDMEFGLEGVIVLAENDEIVVSGLDILDVHRLSDLCPGYDKIQKDKVNDLIFNGASGIGVIKEVNSITAVLFMPESEIYAGRNESLAYLLCGLFVLFMILFEIISVTVQKYVVEPIQVVNRSLAQIRSGNLNERVTVNGNSEFEELSLGINTTVDALKETMRQIEEKNRQEMEFAREVQNSVLPSGSLSGSSFVTLGSMQPAREVGGDFYDYFLIGEDKLGIVIADVSGKGVPAALFMMTAKTLIRNFVLGGRSPAEALRLANVQLCENNEKGMFVTVWLGILDLQNGRLEFANAAHNPPLLKKDGEPFMYMDYKKYRRGLVLGGLAEVRYSNNEIYLSPGDVLFLRLLKCMEGNYGMEPELLLRAVRRDIDDFASGMEQYDDITMVVLKIKA